MRVVSKLAQIDFKFGDIERRGNLLVIGSHPDSRMRSTVHVSPEDIVEALKRLLANPSSLLFFLGLPLFLYRWRRSGRDTGENEATTRRDWPTV